MEIDCVFKSFRIKHLIKSNERSEDSYIGFADFFICFFLKKII